MARRDFGSVRRLPSGRWQARFRDPGGHPHTKTFGTRADAARYLAAARVDIDRGDWFDPTAGQQSLTSYAATWISTRRVHGRPITPRTRERYESVLRTHIGPNLGAVALRDLDPGRVRRWYATLSDAATPGPATVAKCYRLLHAICASAVVDGEIPRNPCMIPGASAERSPERPIATLAQVYALADAVGARWQAMVLLATFCGLRFGELAALTRDRLDLKHATVTITEDLDELGGRLQRGEVKSAASRRSVAITISRPLPSLGEADWSSSGQKADSCAAGTSGAPSGSPPPRRSESRSCDFTTSDTPATRWLPPPARAPAS